MTETRITRSYRLLPAVSGVMTLQIASVANAQGPLNKGPAVPPLPSSPVVARYLFENPWPLVVVLVVACIGVLVAMNQRGRAKQGVAIAAGLALAAAGVWLTAKLVVTPREGLRKQTYRLIDAVIRVDAARAGQILEPEAVAYFREMPTGTAIMPWISTNLSGQYRVREWAVLEEQATIDGPNAARTQFHVRVTAEDYGLPYLGWVRFNWRKDASGAWRVKSVEEMGRGIGGG